MHHIVLNAQISDHWEIASDIMEDYENWVDFEADLAEGDPWA